MDNTRQNDIDPELEKFFAELQQIAWFQSVGQPITVSDVKQVTRLDEAVNCLLDDAWTYASFHNHIQSNHWAWNKAYDLAREAVQRQLQNIQLRTDKIVLEDVVAYDAGGAAYELATQIKERFFSETLMKWYRQGHWPCGWDGQYPDGRLIVF